MDVLGDKIHKERLEIVSAQGTLNKPLVRPHELDALNCTCIYTRIHLYVFKRMPASQFSMKTISSLRVKPWSFSVVWLWFTCTACRSLATILSIRSRSRLRRRVLSTGVSPSHIIDWWYSQKICGHAGLAQLQSGRLAAAWARPGWSQWQPNKQTCITAASRQ